MIEHSDCVLVPDGVEEKADFKAVAIVIAISIVVAMGILLSYLAPGFARISAGRRAKAAGDIRSFKVALREFRGDCGRYPTTSEGLQALYGPPGGLSGWRGPYMEQGPPGDPWNHPYQYSSVGKDDFSIVSLGADGKVGGSGTDADITR